MGKDEIIEIIGVERRVEKMVCNIAHSPLTADLEDLCQMVYLVLLEYKEATICEMWQANEMNFFLARIILTQLHSPRSNYNYLLHHNNNRIDADIKDIIWQIDGEEDT